jgi:hypothetical protein
MNKGINLLGEKKQKPLSPVLKKIEVLRIIAIGLLFTVSSASIVLFLLIFLSPLPALQQREKEALSAIGQYHNDMGRLELINDRLKSSAIIIKQRNNFDEKLSAVYNMMSADLTVTGLVMKEKDIQITVSSSSLSSLEKFINSLILDSEEKKNFSEVSLKSLATDEKKRIFVLVISLVVL